MLKEMVQYCFDVFEQVRVSFEQLLLLVSLYGVQICFDLDSFGVVLDIFVDYVVMEKCCYVVVVLCDIGWSDVGLWVLLSELLEVDECGNWIEGEVLFVDVDNMFVYSDSWLIGVVGVCNLFVIDMLDVLFVVDCDCVQDVKYVYVEFKVCGYEVYKVYCMVYCLWGIYIVFEEGLCFKIKWIVVKLGVSLSLQMYYYCSEYWVVVSGMVKVVNGDWEFLVVIDELIYIFVGYKYWLENFGIVDFVMIEVQSGEYFGEDDIVCFEDNYGCI